MQPQYARESWTLVKISSLFNNNLDNLQFFFNLEQLFVSASSKCTFKRENIIKKKRNMKDRNIIKKKYINKISTKNTQLLFPSSPPSSK